MKTVDVGHRTMPLSQAVHASIPQHERLNPTALISRSRALPGELVNLPAALAGFGNRLASVGGLELMVNVFHVGIHRVGTDRQDAPISL